MPTEQYLDKREGSTERRVGGTEIGVIFIMAHHSKTEYEKQTFLIGQLQAVFDRFSSMRCQMNTTQECQSVCNVSGVRSVFETRRYSLLFSGSVKGLVNQVYISSGLFNITGRLIYTDPCIINIYLIVNL